jgi:hypothetical protein
MKSRWFRYAGNPSRTLCDNLLGKWKSWRRHSEPIMQSAPPEGRHFDYGNRMDGHIDSLDNRQTMSPWNYSITQIMHWHRQVEMGCTANQTICRNNVFNIPNVIVNPRVLFCFQRGGHFMTQTWSSMNCRLKIQTGNVYWWTLEPLPRPNRTIRPPRWMVITTIHDSREFWSTGCWIIRVNLGIYMHPIFFQKPG